MVEISELTPSPIRTCVGCGKRDSSANLIRIVANSMSAPVVDKKRRLSGRGAWIHARKGCFDQARKTRRLTRSLRIAPEVDWKDLEDFFVTTERTSRPRSTDTKAGWKPMGTR